jgi:hypothetical protein
MSRRHCLSPLFLSALLAAPALGQDEAVDDEAIEAAKNDVVTTNADAGADEAADEPDMWDGKLKLGLSGSLLQSNNVVGQVDGITLQGGVVLDGALNFVYKQHDWRNAIHLEHAQTKTPTLEPLIKSSDQLQLSSLYLYHVPGIPWVGPYARLKTANPIFPGYAVAGAQTTFQKDYADGTQEFVTQDPQAPLDLTGWFEPFTISESVGAYAEPLTHELLTLNVKLGVGGQHMLSTGGFVVADDAATVDIVELKQLQTTHSAGAEIEVEASGKVVVDEVTWKLMTNIYYPVLISVDTDLDAFEVTHLDLLGGLSFKVAEWLSLDYQLKVLRAPFVLNDFQIQNTVLLSSGFDLL